ncbi:replication-associated protein [Chiunvirus muliumi]|uniref:ATP-dependent helicase Rep n=1 Tax=Blackfly DNA Virus 12 TaxID=2586175 RepID=A0A4Y5QKV3_9VIRU|nr:replication-associated protein [Blackfly DNA Virus 12]
MARRQGLYWILTISQENNEFEPHLPDSCAYIRGQLEEGANGFRHWQVMAAFTRKTSLRGLQEVFGNCHAELTRSNAARDYVWKEDTRIEGTQFEFGTLAIRRNESTDWESIREHAIAGNLSEVPADVFVRCYSQLRRIGQDHLRPVGMERQCSVFWGSTGTGKSRRAWDEAGMDAYPKDPNSKFWDGYRNHGHVVFDEFRGVINISHMLRWLDRYPVIVEVKGSSIVLCATHIWITSNLDPRLWYPNEDQETVNALLRRLEITHFQ